MVTWSGRRLSNDAAVHQLDETTSLGDLIAPPSAHTSARLVNKLRKEA